MNIKRDTESSKKQFDSIHNTEDGKADILIAQLLCYLQTLGFHHKIPKWSVESVHSKNMVAILHLLVALVRHFR